MRLRLPVLAALAGVATAFGQNLVGNSPFLPRGAAGGVAGAPAEAYELAGSTVQGSEISVCIFERQEKHSLWIPVGETQAGIKVLSYDTGKDVAVVTVNGVRKDLSMRKAAVSAQAPQQAPEYRPPASGSSQVASMETATPSTPETAAQDQREARMLVSDLLEIGVQQRKAYQEAKQRAAAASTQPTN
jgi:hypothetical protein